MVGSWYQNETGFPAHNHHNQQPPRMETAAVTTTTTAACIIMKQKHIFVTLELNFEGNTTDRCLRSALPIPHY